MFCKILVFIWSFGALVLTARLLHKSVTQTVQLLECDDLGSQSLV